MKTWIAVAVAVGILAGSLAGCVNVPEGPYVQWGPGSTSGKTKADVKGFQDFLKKALDDGLINKNQYKELKKRLDKQFKD